MKNKIPTLDWNDTFIDVKHLRASFPDYKIRATEDDRSKHVPPFRYLFLNNIYVYKNKILYLIIYLD